MPQPPSRYTVTFKIGDQPVPGYRLARELGRGTFGVVWLAVTENGFERALKVVNLEQKGGKKEFRALRLIKDRKILHGNLLTLIDYWLLDRDGTILSTPNNITLDTHVPAPKSGSAVSPGTLVSDDRTAQPQVKKLAPGIQGTMMPGNEPTHDFSVRDTFQQQRITDTTAAEENSNAIWLVVAMELGHKTLHDRQKEHTQVIHSKTQTQVGKKGKTRVDNQDGTAGSNTVADRKTTQQSNEDDDLAPLPAEEVLPYMEQAARGLDYLHRCEIVHRDVKPQNIMLVGDVAKVCDYGLASELGDIRATTNAFTLPYAAPEAINKNQPTPASDQYSLAVTYVELRTGRWPFLSNTSTAVYAAKDTGIHHLKFVPNRNVRAVLKKALAKRPQDRFPTCGEFVKQLAKAEATKFNLFATLQAALALLAVVTVLFAASAIHPAVHGPILKSLPDSVGDFFQRKVPVTFDVAEFRKSLDIAEKLFKSDKDTALESFEVLYSKLENLPEPETDLRDRTLVGLARAKAGQTGFKISAVQRAEVLELMRKVSIPSATTINGERSLQTHYLRYVSGGDDAPVEGIDPNAELAKTALLDWELELWREIIADDIPADTQYVSSLDKIIALRKDGNLAGSRMQLTELRSKLDGDSSIPDELRQRVELEDLHLQLAEAALAHDEHLLELQQFVAAQSKVEPRILDRVHLLRLLILGEKHQKMVTYGDAEIMQSIATLKHDLFDAKKLDGLHFSRNEVRDLLQFKDTLKNETRSTTEDLAARSFAPLSQLCSKRDIYLLLVERLRGFLAAADQAATFPAIRQAANDLTAYLDREDPASEFSATELAAADRERADLKLEVNFADPGAVPDDVLKDFVNQVIGSGDTPKWFKRLLDKAADPKWTAASVVPLRYFQANPPTDLAKHAQFADWQRKLESIQLRDIWLVDPSDPAAIQKILGSLKNGSESSLATSAGPLQALLILECEILTTGAPTADKLRDWDSRLKRALFEAENDPELIAYGNFVRARRLALSTADSDQDEAALLMEETLTSAPAHSWLSKSRLQGAGESLAVAAIRNLNVKDAGVLRLNERSLPVRQQLARWQQITASAGLTLPTFPAVAAVVQSTQNGKLDWAEIHRQVSAAQRDSKTAAQFERHQAGRVLDYVSARSALEAAPAKSPPTPELVLAFQRLLVAKDKDQYLYFEYAGKQTDDDARVLEYLVNPVLTRLGEPPDAAVVKKLPAKELAFLWGAKGRLLQRKPEIIIVDPAKDQDDRDSSVVAIVQSNLAFDRARQLDPHVEYVVGYCRTLSALPDAPKTRGETLKEITTLISTRTAEEKQTNPGLRFLVAYSKRLNAYITDKIPEIEAAGQDYKALLDTLPPDDPWGLLPLCREGLSDIHLRLGFLHETVTAREVHQLLKNEEPSPGTKAYHLRLAVSYGKAAVASSHLSKNENAYIALANAYEDYAYYLGIPGAYETSREHFLSGITSARDRGLPLAKARLNYARCLFRHATDRLLELSPADRQSALEEGIGQLEVALKSETLRAEDEVEANLWLAETRWALGNRDTSPAKFEKYEEAMQAYQAATVAAQTNKLTKLQMVAMSRESDARERLWRYYDDPKTKDIIRGPIHQKRAIELDQAGFQLFAANPAVSQPRYVMDLAGNSLMTAAGDRAKRLRWLEGSPAIAKQWNANDEWRLAAVLLHLVFALQQEHEQLELAAARKIVPTITDQQVQLKALVRILEFEATRKCATYNDSLAKNRGIKPEEQAALAEGPFAAMVEVLKVRDQILDNSVTTPNQEIEDLETKELLARVNQMSASSLPKFARHLTPIQKEKLHEVLTTAPNVPFRIHVVKLCLAINGADKTKDGKPSAARVARIRLAHDSVKPFFIFNDEEMTALGLDGLKRSLQDILDGFERELKSADVKFETFTSR